MGGAAGTFIGPEALSMPLSFEGAKAHGTTLGSGVVFVIDETVDFRALLRRIAAFFRDESCGQCVPCRVGTVRQEELLHREELSLLKELGRAMRDASICGLGQTASSAIESGFRFL
jgi:NADH-quinone oxidoreductase subunit F